jgi:hypothetical protein
MLLPNESLPHFYFALPRLMAKLWGGSAARTQNNWTEANIAGAASFLVSYAAALHLLTATVTTRWKQIVLVLLALLVTWLFWLMALYINSLVIKLLRACGIIRGLPDDRAQSVLIGIITTAFACWVIAANSSLRVIAVVWIAGVSLNLIAAAVLVFIAENNDAGI